MVKTNVNILYILLVFIVICSSCYQTNSNELDEKVNKIETPQDSNQNEVELKNSNQKIIAKSEKEIMVEDNNEFTEKNKLKQERQDLRESTKRIIKRNQSIPSFKVDSTRNRFEQRVNFYHGIECYEDKYSKLNNFSIQINNIYPNSSTKTKKYDGKIFCLRQLNIEGSELSLLVYGRNEGGHTSDMVEIITADNEEHKIYILPLSYQTGWDGHETIVESNINDRVITRKITERFGWSNMYSDSLAKQPRREVLQIIRINNNGAMEKIREKINQYNIDKLFN